MDNMSNFLTSEVDILKRVNSPNILKLYYYFEDSQKIYLLMELAKDGNLYTLLRNNERLTETEALKVN